MEIDKRLDRNIGEIWQEEYTIPLYQRNFAWEDGEIKQLLQDLYDNFKNEGDGQYFLGSLVTIKPDSRDSYEVIDGQQRLTVLSILCVALGVLSVHKLKYDSRPEAEKFLIDLFKFVRYTEKIKDRLEKVLDFHDQCIKNELPKVTNLIAALKSIYSTRINISEEGTKSLSMMAEEELKAFAEYLKEHVMLVHIVLPPNTDVASYFEIMNNRGVQLQEHEIVKASLIENADDKDRQMISDIWNTCSNMNDKVSNKLNKYHDGRKFLFFGGISCQDSGNNGFKSNYPTLGQIISSEIYVDIPGLEKNKSGEDIDTSYKSIIDFPNFLMLVIRSLSEKEGINIPLNSDKLLSSYRKLKVNSLEFIGRLLEMRIAFDKYIIKNYSIDSESCKWMLDNPAMEGDSNDNDSYTKRRVIKQQSMLQVSAGGLKNKTWLYKVLSFIISKDDESNILNEIMSYLDKEILSRYHTLADSEEDLLTQGVNTHHFLFNFIDYLYWIEKMNKCTKVPNIEFVQDFDFRYYNSVEHHVPNSYKLPDELKNSIGNLYLISGSQNSSMSNKSAAEKAKIRRAYQPKQQIMFGLTNRGRDWTKEDIESHAFDIKCLLESCDEIIDAV